MEQDQFRVIRARFRELGKLLLNGSEQAGLSLISFVIGHRAMRIADPELGEFHRSRTFLVVVRNIVDPSAYGIASHQPSIVGLQHLGRRCQFSSSRIKPQVIAVWIKNHWHPVVHGEARAFGVVVRIEQVSTTLPLGSLHRSHIPANANNSPSSTSKQYGCLAFPVLWSSRGPTLPSGPPSKNRA